MRVWYNEGNTMQNALPSPTAFGPDISHVRRNLAALSYAWILSIPVLLAAKDDAFVGPHARQGTLLFVLSILAWFIPYAGYVIEIVLGITMITGYLRSSQGRPFSLPLSTEGISRIFERGKAEWRKIRPQGTSPLNTGPSPAGTSERENQWAACAYLSIASIVVADNAGDSATVRFHARQGVTIFMLSLVAGLLGQLGQYLLILLLIASVTGFLSALMGKAVRLPLLYALSLRLPPLERAWGGIRRTVMGWLGKADAAESAARTIPDERERSLALLSYFLLGPVILLSPHPSAFASFHARQGLLLNMALVGLYASSPTAYSALGLILSLTILGASRSYQGVASRLPIVAEVVDGIAGCLTLMNRHAHPPQSPPQAISSDRSLHDG